MQAHLDAFELCCVTLLQFERRMSLPSASNNYEQGLLFYTVPRPCTRPEALNADTRVPRALPATNFLTQDEPVTLEIKLRLLRGNCTTVQ